MKTITLLDHDLSESEYSKFELGLQGYGAILKVEPELYTSGEGVRRARLRQPVIDYDESQSDRGKIEALLGAYGFRERTP
jgi:hypothetical protein